MTKQYHLYYVVHGTTLCVIHKLLFRVWVLCVCELVFVDAPTTQEKIKA